MELAAAVARAVDKGIDIVLAAQTITNTGMAGIAEPYSELAAASRGTIGLVGVRPDSDGVLRNYIPYALDKDGGFIYGLSLVAVAKFSNFELPQTPLPNGDIPLTDGLLIKVEDGQFPLNFRGGPGTHLTLTAGDLLRGDRDFTSDLRGKMVFVGVTDPSVEDLLPSPFSGTDRMAGVEFHATAADTLLNGSFLRIAPGYQVVLILGLFGICAIVLGRFVRPLLGIAGAAAGESTALKRYRSPYVSIMGLGAGSAPCPP
ncbi:MAG: CHASE2 domain-containing protein [Planctomycetes bacterium]|nr:CHASE2 domain-containing protein [Planctomycetota bacterium]